ncbi:pseudouridine synthase [Dyadobacter sp. CY323]|uniref:pseudouridine synthase n=1 Tax=Dyadobacter sp. CY323 TaxID=2907302 RepID=UPI001F3BBA96|nr:pseudouridine synthase [Dyadobacter sp. CY323]MCE6989120.1 pseudouridine synthase [Dyadobacter sp. CY323]
MRKRTNNSKPASASRPSSGGSGNFRNSSDSASRPFKRAKPEVESRFSKPSIKKSSLRATGPSDNQGQKARPSFDHEKSSSERPRFDKPDFKKYGASKSDFQKPRPFKRDDDSRGGNDRRDAGKTGADRDTRSFRPREDYRPREEKPRGEFRPRENDRPRDDNRPKGVRRAFGDKPERPRSDRDNESREFKPRTDSDRSERSFPPRERSERSERPDFKRVDRPGFKSERPGFKSERPAFKSDRPDSRSDRPDSRSDRPDFKKKDDTDQPGERSFRERAPRDEQSAPSEDRSGLDRRVGRFETAPRYNLSGYEKKNAPAKKKEESNEIRLNRYIANAGICSRREADDLISSGQISVNGKTVTEMGYKVKAGEVVKYGKKALNPEKMVYVLINKPKDYITTTDDPEERKTVLDLIKGACSERVYPVGRLDRNTTGLLLLTNDGELAEKLTHPSGGVKKIYQAELDKPITTEDFELLQHGLELEDGFIRPDEVGIVTPDAMVVGLEIHSGRNRIVRRMFEHLGYEVQKLDRTVFAGLNKKDLPRGKWRFLSEKEVIKLKFML